MDVKSTGSNIHLVEREEKRVTVGVHQEKTQCCNILVNLSKSVAPVRTFSSTYAFPLTVCVCVCVWINTEKVTFAP